MGPLAGLKVIELMGLGPAPFCSMLLADMGAEVILVERKAGDAKPVEVTRRNRRSIALNLKQQQGIDTLLALVDKADVLIEGFRPGVTERLGIGPEVCLERNPGLIYGRMTGWGQEGPMASAAGHDINYISLTGALHAIGRKGDAPVPPLNLVGDYGGGSMYLAFGILSALYERQQSGKGQVIDAAMVDGAASLMTLFHDLREMGSFTAERGAHFLNTGAPHYEVYETKTDATVDKQYISVGPLEPQFYDLLIDTLGLNREDFYPQADESQWPRRKEILAAVFLTRSRQEWCDLLEGSDACFSPVLSMWEAPEHHHMKARGTFIDIEGVQQPAPAPRFSRSQPAVPVPPRRPGEDSVQVLQDYGFDAEAIEQLLASGAVMQ
ncbi:CaiB/BaiF CoA transferase family protein [Oceanicoccus sagamiensis]|uniref:Carnitine dehydratase n=1 Tax=Oceanicoccus sagamiensis TaxID=716816 RepID=A0A1X9NGY2_9GAMM|nr:CaiB/BaiF CoA-transferase family protein [Oceanicoccus sagamiensis]ARN75652.1 carnitine dehydratase [Oceanicoccus sagamiensis]